MFRRSKIKITPKIPQTKPNVDRVNESLSHIQSPNLCVSNTSVENESTKQQENKVSEPLTVKPPEPASIISIKSKDSVPMVDLTTPQSVERQPSVNEQHNEKQITLTTLIEPADESPGPSESSPNLEQDTSQDKMSPQKSPQKDNASSISIPNEQLSNGSPVSSLALSSVDRVQRTSVKLVASDTDKSKTQIPSTNSTISSSSKAAPAALIRDKCHVDPIKPRKRIKLTPKDLLDRSSITLYHLIHAPMSRAKRTDKKKAKEKKPEQSTDENVEKNPNPKDTVQLDASKVINEDTMDSTITTASSATTIITSELGADETTEKETIGPRVKVGPDGQLIIDEESLVIKKPKPIETQTIEEPINGKTTYASFRKRAPTARWSKAETIEFYTALNLIGPDFSLMSNLFFSGKRSRTDLKNKFRRENKLNKTVIEKALYEADVEYCLAQEAVQVEQS